MRCRGGGSGYKRCRVCLNRLVCGLVGSGGHARFRNGSLGFHGKFRPCQNGPCRGKSIGMNPDCGITTQSICMSSSSSSRRSIVTIDLNPFRYQVTQLQQGIGQESTTTGIATMISIGSTGSSMWRQTGQSVLQGHDTECCWSFAFDCGGLCQWYGIVQSQLLF